MSLKRRAIAGIVRWLDLKRVEQRMRGHRLRLEDTVREIVDRDGCLRLRADRAHERLDTLGPSSSGLALVSVMPPADTGVATFGLRLACAEPGALDIFTGFDTLTGYFDTAAALHGRAELFPIEMLALAAKIRRYRTIVFAVANSDHNTEVVRRLVALPRDLAETVVIEVHDPVLFNIGRRAVPDPAALDRRYARAYPQLPRSFGAMTDAELLDRGISGFSALFGHGPATSVVVHSAAAQAILERDMAGDWRLPVTRLFHPIFPSLPPAPSARPAAAPRPVVGCFGVPGADKYLDETIAACRTLIAEGRVGRVIFAGFGAAGVRDHLGADAADRAIAVHDGPDDATLEALMHATDVAVQPRRHNVGESSGVVAQLTALGKRVVCSPIGSFLEYDGLVTYIEGEATPAAIAAAVRRALEGAGPPEAARRAFVEARSPGRLLRALADAGSAAPARGRPVRAAPPHAARS